MTYFLYPEKMDTIEEECNSVTLSSQANSLALIRIWRTWSKKSVFILVESDSCDTLQLSLMLYWRSTAIWNVDACKVYLIKQLKIQYINDFKLIFLQQTEYLYFGDLKRWRWDHENVSWSTTIRDQYTLCTEAWLRLVFLKKYNE